MAKKATPVIKKARTAPYKHPEAKSLMRPKVGTQAQFKKKKPPKTYRYDSSLSPELDWDAKNPARQQGEAPINLVQDAKSLRKPFLNWAGKGARLSTKGIIKSLVDDKIRQQQSMFALFGNPQRSIYAEVLKAYEHQDNWTL